MIQWPEETNLPPIAREGLRAFRETTAPLELATSEEVWTVSAWPWLDEAPLRVSLQNQENDGMEFTLDEDGIWRLTYEPRPLVRRTPESIEEEARAWVVTS